LRGRISGLSVSIGAVNMALPVASFETPLWSRKQSVSHVFFLPVRPRSSSSQPAILLSAGVVRGNEHQRRAQVLGLCPNTERVTDRCRYPRWQFRHAAVPPHSPCMAARRHRCAARRARPDRAQAPLADEVTRPSSNASRLTCDRDADDHFGSSAFGAAELQRAPVFANDRIGDG
jgi:hypothetical protein